MCDSTHFNPSTWKPEGKADSSLSSRPEWSRMPLCVCVCVWGGDLKKKKRTCFGKIQGRNWSRSSQETLFSGLGSRVLSSLKQPSPPFIGMVLPIVGCNQDPQTCPKTNLIIWSRTFLSPGFPLRWLYAVSQWQLKLRHSQFVKSYRFSFNIFQHFCLQLPAELQLSVVFSIGTP